MYFLNISNFKEIKRILNSFLKVIIQYYLKIQNNWKYSKKLNASDTHELIPI